MLTLGEEFIDIEKVALNGCQLAHHGGGSARQVTLRIAKFFVCGSCDGRGIVAHTS